MIGQLRRFVTSPLPLFEYGFASESRAPPPLSAAAKCFGSLHQGKSAIYNYFTFMLSQSKLAPGDDLVMSNMYSLLNYIAATSKDTYDSNNINAHSLAFNPQMQSNSYSLETGLRGLSEDEKRLIGISTISAVTRLALEFKIEEVRKNIAPTVI